MVIVSDAVYTWRGWGRRQAFQAVGMLLAVCQKPGLRFWVATRAWAMEAHPHVGSANWSSPESPIGPDQSLPPVRPRPMGLARRGRHQGRDARPSGQSSRTGPSSFELASVLGPCPSPIAWMWSQRRRLVGTQRMCVCGRSVPCSEVAPNAIAHRSPGTCVALQASALPALPPGMVPATGVSLASKPKQLSLCP